VGDVHTGESSLSLQDVFARLAGAVEKRDMTPRRCGEIRRFDEQKNYGFIVPDDGGADVFFHGSVVRGRVDVGQRVEFDSEQGDKGPRATVVCLSFFMPLDDLI
jgi:CspA family cold shock protein